MNTVDQDTQKAILEKAKQRRERVKGRKQPIPDFVALRGNRVELARREIGFTQEELGILIGLNNNTISGIENNHANTFCDVLYKLCTTLNVSADWLLGLKDDKE